MASAPIITMGAYIQQKISKNVDHILYFAILATSDTDIPFASISSRQTLNHGKQLGKEEASRKNPHTNQQPSTG